MTIVVLGVLDPEDLIGPLDLLPQELVLPLLVLGEFLLLFEMLFQVEEVLRELLNDMVIPFNLTLMHLQLLIDIPNLLILILPHISRTSLFVITLLLPDFFSYLALAIRSFATEIDIMVVLFLRMFRTSPNSPGARIISTNRKYNSKEHHINSTPYEASPSWTLSWLTEWSCPAWSGWASNYSGSST